MSIVGIWSRDVILQKDRKNMATVNMKNYALSLLLFIAVLSSISLGEQPKSITQECKKRCERSYPPHTYPKVGISSFFL